MTVAIMHHGGVAVGAFEELSGKMLGFALSFVAPTRLPNALGGLSHHSHMAAVTENYRGLGLGAQLKRAQRDVVLARGYNLMTWTFDPLEARNANLNVRKLGCICRTYERNLYGTMADNLNADLPSDRFEVEWWLDHHRPIFAENQPVREIEIPTDFQAIKKDGIQKAREWRMRTREQFEQAFNAGYVVTAFTRLNDRAWYTLRSL